MEIHLYPFQNISLLLVITTTICLFHVRKSSAADYDRYLNCSASFQCVNFRDVHYPFWGSSRPDYCGYPDFKLNCSGDAPVISFDGQDYRVLDINQSTSTLRVARTDFWNNVCPVSLANTTIKSSRVENTSDVQQVLLFYNCPAPYIPLPNQPISQFSCSINSTATSTNYFDTNLGLPNISDYCETTVTASISQSAAANLVLNSSKDNLVAALDSGILLKWDASNTLCDQCRGSGGQCGYNISSAEFTCFCKDGHTPSNCEGAGDKQLKLKLGLVGAASVIVVLVVVCCFFWNKRIQKHQIVEALLRSHGPLQVQRHSYSEVKKMTNSFKEKLGQGGYGAVYKGKLKDGRLVAVKVLTKLKGDGEEFMNEVAAISRTSHVNIVSLLGYCFECSKRALIYEFMPNGSLEKFIFNASNPKNDHHHLGWETLDQISLGIARGLEYLHRGCNTRILHFDIKPHNILLNEKFTPKISDFGLAKICNRNESIMSMLGARGTAGYIAPELFSRNFGKVSHKSDVYSYGMMLSEMVEGRRNIDTEVENTSEIYFPHWIYQCLERDEELGLQSVTNEEDKVRARKMIIVSLWCIQTDPSNRPAMKEVIDMLEGSVDSLQIPPKPYLSSPPKSPADSSTTLVSMQ